MGGYLKRKKKSGRSVYLSLCRPVPGGGRAAVAFSSSQSKDHHWPDPHFLPSLLSRERRTKRSRRGASSFNGSRDHLNESTARAAAPIFELLFFRRRIHPQMVCCSSFFLFPKILIGRLCPRPARVQTSGRVSGLASEVCMKLTIPSK